MFCFATKVGYVIVLLVVHLAAPRLYGQVPSAVAITNLPSVAGRTISDEDREFLDTLQERTFRYFWETANPANGLAPDRWPHKSASSIAAVGFGLTAYGVGVERGWIAREAAAERVATTLRFFWNAPQGPEPDASGHHGFYYHFLDIDSGRRYRQCELSSIDTALLMAGALFCREYFDGDLPRETEIRDLADRLVDRVEWDWMQPRRPLVAMGWRPENGFTHSDYQGYDEAMLLYLLALGSRANPVDPEAWKAFTSTYLWADFQGYEHANFGPLFGHQYSHVWIDFRGIQDPYMREAGIDYFENSRRATYSQQAYAIENPSGWKGYGENQWGLTACDGPGGGELEYAGEQRRFFTYHARGASCKTIRDDGTIAPTAAGGSIPFAPEIALPALRAMRETYGDHLFGPYGFLDSFNPSFTFPDIELRHGKVTPSLGWFDDDYLGIDQGPILLMAENFRTGLIWRIMRKNANLRLGLERANFTGGWLDDSPD